MNIQVQICGLCILLLLILFYKSHETLRLYKEKLFFNVVCIITISLFADVLSLVAIYYKEALPSLFVNGICKFYLITLLWGVWSALVYVVSDLMKESRHIQFCRKLLLVILLQSLLVSCLPISIFDDGKTVYTYGAAVNTIYGFVALYIVATLAVSVKFRKQLNPRRRFGVVLWMLIWMASATFQVFNNGILIVGFASAIGVLILFVIMENPEANLDRRFGYFNSYALSEYIGQMYDRESSFGVLDITLEYSNVREEGEADEDEILRKILKIAKSYSGFFVFKNYNTGLMLASEDASRVCLVSEALGKEIAEDALLQKTVRGVLVEHAEALTGLEELLHFLNFARSEGLRHKRRILTTDESFIARFKEQFQVEQEIREALLQDRVEVFLQPFFSPEKGKFTSAEALVRIRKTEGGYMSPGLFIPVAEKNGQILALGERVFEKVCQMLKETRMVELGMEHIEVNLSVVQCEKKNLADTLIQIVENYQIAPGRINLEITETASINAKQILLENMEKLIEYGFTFSLDDFGKGESNLMYIVEMPVTIVKLDYDMTKAFFDSDKAKQVVKAVIGMVHRLGLKLVAEGVETREESEQLQKEGVDYIQGFYYSKPIPLEEFLHFVECENSKMSQVQE